MLNLDEYSSLGAALRAALDRWANETCLIEADRDREKTRLTYSDLKDLALPLARAFEDAEFTPGDRLAIIMTNQSKWLVSAYAIFYGGGVLVPLDYKLTAAEHLQLLAHSKPKLLIVDLTESPYMDSAGLGSLMNGYVHAQKAGRRLVLAGANERVKALLELTKVDLILKNYATAVEAY